LLDKEDVDLMSKLNFYIQFDLESGSEEMLCIIRKANRPKLYLKKCEEMINYLNKKEVPYKALLMFNHPGETPVTYNRSIAFFGSLIKKQDKISGMLSAQDYAFFPGSRIHGQYDYYQKRFGTVVRHQEWWKERGDQHKLTCSIIPSRGIVKTPRQKSALARGIV